MSDSASHSLATRRLQTNKLCGSRYNMPLPLSSLCGRRSASRRRADRNVAVGYHSQYVPLASSPLQLPDALKPWWINRPGDLDLWLWPLTLKVVSESRVTWATSVPILVFLGLSVLDLGPMYATGDSRETLDVRRQTASSFNVPAIRGEA